MNWKVLLVGLGLVATTSGYAQSVVTDRIPTESSFGPATKGILNSLIDSHNAVVSNAAGTTAVNSLTASNAVSSGDYTVGTNVDFSAATVTVTNGAALTLTSSYTELNNTGQASTTTTNTFAAFSAAQVGRLFFIQAAAANTDSIAFLETGVLVSGGTLTLGPSDGFIGLVAATNILRQVSAVMNN